MLIADEGDLSHLHHRAFLDVECHLHRGWGNRLDVGLHCRELVSVRGKQFLDHVLGVLDPGGVVLALHRKAHLLLFEGVQNVGVGHRVVALVDDVADRRLLPDKNVQDHAVL